MTPTMARKNKPKFAQPDRPAVISGDHVQDRILSPVAGAPKGWRNLSPLERAFRKGQLRGGLGRYSENQRFEAGSNYAQIYLVANAGGGRDSTQSLNVSRSSGGFSFPQSQQDAIYLIAHIETSMGVRDCRIVRKVCGEGHEPVRAVQDICGDYEHTIAARFREALDGLIESFDRYRREGQKKAS